VSLYYYKTSIQCEWYSRAYVVSKRDQMRLTVLIVVWTPNSSAALRKIPPSKWPLSACISKKITTSCRSLVVRLGFVGRDMVEEIGRGKGPRRCKLINGGHAETHTFVHNFLLFSNFLALKTVPGSGDQTASIPPISSRQASPQAKLEVNICFELQSFPARGRITILRAPRGPQNPGGSW
jgi:hypothetical protein